MYKFLMLLSIYLTFFASPAGAYQAPYAEQAPQIDGDAKEAVWADAQWHPIDKLTLGSMPSTDDFSARYKVVWTEERLYILAEIIDDVLIDTHAHPLQSYWEDDTFEVLIDEDKSGGDHLNNYNAFAYHIGLDNQVVDINNNGQPQLFNDHVESSWKRSTAEPSKVIWEVGIFVYPDTYVEGGSSNLSIVNPVKLLAGKELGLLVAYCDSDDQNGRQHFLGSVDVPAKNGDKNRAYIDASVFGSLTLIE